MRQCASRSAGSREAARRFAEEHAFEVREWLGLGAGPPGTVQLFDALEPAVATAWLVVESVPEDLALKKQVFGELDRLTEPDAILETNSSSYPSSCLAGAVDTLAGRLPRYGLVPFTVMRESVGFLFNRIWHATRRAKDPGWSHDRGVRAASQSLPCPGPALRRETHPATAPDQARLRRQPRPAGTAAAAGHAPPGSR